MTSHHVHYVPADGAATAQFASSADAWAFMRLCDSQDVPAGYPVPDSWNCTVCG